MNRLATIALPLVLLSAACGGGNDNLPPPPPPPPPPMTTATAPTPTATAEDAGPPPPAAPPVTLQEGTPSPDPATPLPTVKLLTPAKEQVIASKDAPDFTIKLDVKNWETAKGSSHVHLILDNKPYKPIYDPKKEQVKLSELMAGAAIDDGQHVLVAFPSRANHESVKTKGALFMTEFWVGKKGQPAVDLTKPMLIYSRPKGDYKGDFANHVLIDFQIANDTLAEGKDHVAIAVTGPGIDDKLTANVKKIGTPFYLDNLQNGSYTVKLDLLDAAGNPVAGPWNSTTRTIKIDHDAQPDPMPGMAMGAAGAADAGAPSAAPAVSKPATPAKPAPKPKK